MAGAEIALPAPLIRSASLDVRGFSVAHPPLECAARRTCASPQHAAGGEHRDRRRAACRSTRSAAAWERQRQAAGGPKSVLVP